MAPKLQAMGISSQRISYLPQAADILEVSNYDSGLAESLGIRPTDFVVTFAGNLGRAQSLDTLLASARRLQDVFATNDRVSKPAVVSKSPAPNKSKVKFLVIGDGTEKEKIAKQIVDQKLDNVQLIGWVEKDDLSRYFSITSAFVVLLNDNEVLNLTLPAKVQTYMTVGKPVLASTGNATPMNPSNSVNLPNPAVSDLSELARVIREADCGLVSPAGDSKTLTANILKMWQFPKSKLQKLGSNSRTYSREHFDQRKLYANLEQLLVKIAETKI
jgi:glycosyltransferase involved in cell wall biosynthesis